MHDIAFTALIVGVVFGIPVLVTMTPIGSCISRIDQRGEPRRMRDPIYALLRRELVRVGRQFEAMPYDGFVSLPKFYPSRSSSRESRFQFQRRHSTSKGTATSGSAWTLTQNQN